MVTRPTFIWIVTFPDLAPAQQPDAFVESSASARVGWVPAGTPLY